MIALVGISVSMFSGGAAAFLGLDIVAGLGLGAVLGVCLGLGADVYEERHRN